ATSAAQMWSQLRAAREARGALGLIGTRRKLYKTEMEEGTPVMEYIEKMRGYWEELLRLGDTTVDDAIFSHLLITSLPESWDDFCQGFFGANSTTLTVNSQTITQLLATEDERRRRGRSEKDSVTD